MGRVQIVPAIESIDVLERSYRALFKLSRQERIDALQPVVEATPLPQFRGLFVQP